MKIVLAGGSGFVGRSIITACLDQGDEITVLARLPGRAAGTLPPGIRLEAWDGATAGPWADAFEGADALINLAGEPLAAKRWTAVRKEAILKSRIDTTRALVAGTRRCVHPPRVFINASAVGYYGSVPEGDVTEEHSPGTGFLPETCMKWEEEARAAERPGVRVILARIGVAMGPDGGALKIMTTPFRFFLGGYPGSGTQWLPWIHIRDLAASFRFIAASESLSGPVNLTAPAPVRMADFCKSLGRVLHRPSWIPVPGFALRIAAGEMARMILTGQRALPGRLAAAGFGFAFPEHEAALRDILRPSAGTIPSGPA